MNFRKIGSSKWLKIAATGAGSVLTLGIAAAAVAQSSSAADGVLHACVNKQGVLRLVDASAACKQTKPRSPGISKARPVRLAQPVPPAPQGATARRVATVATAFRALREALVRAARKAPRDRSVPPVQPGPARENRPHPRRVAVASVAIRQAR